MAANSQIGVVYAMDDIMRRYPTRELTGTEKALVDAVKHDGQALYDTISRIAAAVGNSPDLTLAKRKVEEAVMWAVKHITA